MKVSCYLFTQIWSSSFIVISPTDKASGNSVDWAHGTLGIPFTYAVELPDTGHHGFLLPPRYIIPTGEETLEAVKVIGHAAVGYNAANASTMTTSLTTAWFAYACFVVLRRAAAYVWYLRHLVSYNMITVSSEVCLYYQWISDII